MALPGPKVSFIFKHINGTVDDGTGNIRPKWETYLTVLGTLVEVTSRNKIISGQPSEISSHIAILPYSTAAAGITPSMRLFYGSREFDILSVNNPGELNISVQVSIKEVIQS